MRFQGRAAKLQALLLSTCLLGCSHNSSRPAVADSTCPCPIEIRVVNSGTGTGAVWVNGVKLQCPAIPIAISGSMAECGRATFQPPLNTIHLDIIADNAASQIASFPLGGSCASGGSSQKLLQLDCALTSSAGFGSETLGVVFGGVPVSGRR